MCAQMECWILTSKNLVKFKQYYYFHANFLEVIKRNRYGAYFLNCLKSHILMIPSSPPDAMNGSFLFHDMTLTSLSWALVVIIQALWGAALQSHMRTVLSTEQDAKTYNVIEQNSTTVNNYNEKTLTKFFLIIWWFGEFGKVYPIKMGKFSHAHIHVWH